jgi:hypothetical protein
VILRLWLRRSLTGHPVTLKRGFLEQDFGRGIPVGGAAVQLLGKGEFHGLEISFSILRSIVLAG